MAQLLPADYDAVTCSVLSTFGSCVIEQLRYMCINNSTQGRNIAAEWSGFKPATYQVQCPNYLDHHAR